MCIHHRVPICCVMGLHVQFCFLCGWIHEWGSLCGMLHVGVSVYVCVHIQCICIYLWLCVCVTYVRISLCVCTYTVYMHVFGNLCLCLNSLQILVRMWELAFLSTWISTIIELLFYPFCWPCYLLSCPGSGSLASGSKQSGFVITREIEEAGTTEKVVFSWALWVFQRGGFYSTVMSIKKVELCACAHECVCVCVYVCMCRPGLRLGTMLIIYQNICLNYSGSTFRF